MIHHFFSAQFLKFLFVGVTAAFANWIARYGFSVIWPFPVAVALAYIVGMAVAYSLNRAAVFPTSNRPVLKQSMEFALINVLFFPVVWSASLLLNEILGYLRIVRFSEGAAHALALSIPMMLTFLIYKFRTFRVE